MVVYHDLLLMIHSDSQAVEVVLVLYLLQSVHYQSSPMMSLEVLQIFELGVKVESSS